MAGKCFVAGCKTPAWQGLAYCYAHCSRFEIANIVVALEEQVAALTAERNLHRNLVTMASEERDRYREALAGLVARFTMNGRCVECGLKECAAGCDMREARELLKKETK